jgi:drug/metabolite transporter (DMT)-like permease
MTELEKQRRLKVATSFGLVYVLWGGTYLAMRVAVEHIPPYVMGAVRYLIAGPLMLGYLALVGKKIRISRRDAARLLVVGFLLLSVGNMGVAWAEEYLPSGMAALIAPWCPSGWPLSKPGYSKCAECLP